MKLLKRLFREEEGATMVEYALIVALIAIVAIAATQLAGEAVSGVFEYIETELLGATTPTTP